MSRRVATERPACSSSASREIGRDLGGNVAAVEVDFGDGRTRRLKGFEAGEIRARSAEAVRTEKGKRKRGYLANVLLDQKPTRSTDRR